MRPTIFHKFLIVILLIVIPFILFSIYHARIMSEKEMAQWHEENLRLSRKIAEELDLRVDRTWSLLRALSLHPSVLGLNSSECDRIAGLLLKEYPEYLNILGATMDGWNFCSAVPDPAFRNLNYRDMEWFQEGSKGRPYAGNLHISKYFKRPAIMITMPVFRGKDQIALLGASLNLEVLSEWLVGYSERSYLEIILLDRTGEVIVNTRNPGRTVGINLTRSEDMFTSAGPDGVKRLYSFSTSRNGYKVIVGINLDYVEKRSNEMSKEYLGVVFILGILSVLLSLLFSSRLKRGFDILMRGIKELEKGNYSYRLDVSERGEVARIAEVLNELSERLQTTLDSLKESEEFYHSLIENSPDIILVTDRSGLIIYGSPSLNNLGYKPDEVKERSIFEFLDPAYRPELKREIDEAIKNPGRIYDATLRIFHRDGSLRLLKGRGRYIPERDCLVMNCIDITEEMKRDNLLNDILSSISDGFLILDRDMKVVSANRALLKSLGRELSEIRDRYCWEVSHRQDRPCYLLGEVCPVKETLRTSEPSMALHTHYSSTNEPIYVEVRAYPLKDLSGKVTGVIEVISDITEKKRLEAQLLQAQKMEAIGQLAGGVAHDFNNILTAIGGYGSLLEMKLPEGSPLKEYASEILKAVERGSNLAKGLLAFSRKQPGNPQPVDLNEIVRMVVKLLLKLLREDIRVEVDLYKDELIIMADAGHIEQVMMNLATNARDAMPEGGVITIRTERVYIDERFRDIHGYGTPGEYALLSFSDTGIGMDDTIKARIFEPFFTTKEEGTGLGLSIVYGIVKQYNGYINVYSEPGKGSTFKIYLPLYMAEEKADLSKKRQVVFIKGLGETVLLVDDDAEVRESIRHVLDFAGYKVIEASDGLEALEIFKERMNEIDLVITDLIMPRKNGRALYDDIKALKPSQRVVFITGHTAESLYREYLPEDGVILFKPVLPSEFLRKIREQLQ